MNLYSDFILFCMEGSERINAELSGIYKLQAATLVSNESAVYYSLASESLTEKIGNFIKSVIGFIVDLIKKTKDGICSLANGAIEKNKVFI